MYEIPQKMRIKVNIKMLNDYYVFREGVNPIEKLVWMIYKNNFISIELMETYTIIEFFTFSKKVHL